MKAKLLIVLSSLAVCPTVMVAQVGENLDGDWVGCYSVTPEESSDVEGLDFVPAGVTLRADTAVAPYEAPPKKEGPYPHTAVSRGQPMALLVAEVRSSSDELVEARTVWSRTGGNAWVMIGPPGRSWASLLFVRAPARPAAIFFSTDRGRRTQLRMDVARAECS